MCGALPELVLAPIRGITDCIYRTAFARQFPGFDRAIAPFVQLRQDQPFRPGEVRQLVRENNRAMPMVPQLLTHEARPFIRALRELRDLGHDEANWNLGCPSRTVAGRGRGAGLLPHPQRIDAILDAVLSQCPVRLSAKVRLGLHSPEELAPVLLVLNRYPLSEVILHPRLAGQIHDGLLDLGRTREALSTCRHRFVFSGGLSTIEAYADLSRQLPEVHAWMIGRGALSCPRLPARIKGSPEVAPEAFRRALHEFHKELLERYAERLSGPAHVLAKMKEHWAYLAVCFAEPRSVFIRIRRSRHLDAFAGAVEWAFAQPLARVS